MTVPGQPGGTLTPTGGIVTASPPVPTTATPSPGSATTVVDAARIVLSIQVAAPTAGPLANGTNLRKRQAVASTGELGYIADDGTTGSCASARQYELANGELFDVQGGFAIGTTTSLQTIDLNDPADGSIVTTFSLVAGILVWTNLDFYNNTAVFCLLNSVLYVSFTAEGPPSGCTLVNLGAVQGSYSSP